MYRELKLIRIDLYRTMFIVMVCRQVDVPMME